ncbi:MAG: serine hydrolase domain-containing protein [Caldilineaceae bacterium]
MRRLHQRTWFLAANILVAFLIFLNAFPSPVLAQAQATPTLTPTELRAFLDGLINTQLAIYHIPGATVSVVQNGKLVFTQGYGYADVARQTPVVADKTLFRPGSISKLFVWTAVMQLVEQGKLDLNADVNTYLKDFKIPATYPQPITLANLMTHTPGFEDQGLELFVAKIEQMHPLGDYLKTHQPARIRPPGELTAYSNYGASLAGYIVAQVSGMPFEQYVQEHIFKPLAMNRSTFQQPLPAILASDMARGYIYTGSSYAPQDFELVQSAPAGALSSTATDMANFMIAHLQNGQFGANRILQTATAQAMHKQSFTNDPRVGGFAHGFMEATINSQHLIWHGGDTLYFHSALVLLPEQNTGFFVSYNGSTGELAVLSTLRTFMDHYYPAPQAPQTTAPTENLARYAGAYGATRGNQTTVEKALNLFQTVTVAPTGTQELLVSVGAPAQLTFLYKAVEPLVFRSADLPPTPFGDLVFRADAQGRITAMFQQNNPTAAYLPLPWYAASGLNFTLIGLCALLFLSIIIWGPIGFWINRRFRLGRPFRERLASWVAGLLSLLSLAFLIGFIILFSNPQTALGLPAWAQILFALPWGIAVLAIFMLLFMLVAWARRYWSIPGRIHYTLVTLAALAFVWWLIYWNLLPIHI